MDTDELFSNLKKIFPEVIHEETIPKGKLLSTKVYDSLDRFKTSYGAYSIWLDIEDFQDFKEKWNSHKKSKKKVPNIKRKVKHNSVKTCIYVGQRKSGLRGRIREHLFCPKNGHYSLHLESFFSENDSYRESLEVQYFYVGVNKTDRPLVCEALEILIKAKLKPIIGDERSGNQKD